MNHFLKARRVALPLLSILLALLPELAPAEPSLPARPPFAHWSSEDDSKTEIWLIAKSNGTLEMHGRDLVSSYNGLVFADKNMTSWTCHGTGFRFVGGLPFTYRSTFRLETSDGETTLVETWSATLPNHETIEGTTRLKPVVEVD